MNPECGIGVHQAKAQVASTNCKLEKQINLCWMWERAVERNVVVEFYDMRKLRTNETWTFCEVLKRLVERRWSCLAEICCNKIWQVEKTSNEKIKSRSGSVGVILSSERNFVVKVPVFATSANIDTLASWKQTFPYAKTQILPVSLTTPNSQHQLHSYTVNWSNTNECY